jgi:Tfp pilus assembly protein PilP
MESRGVFIAFALALLCCSPVAGQQPAGDAGAAGPQPQGYTYESGGRRDPFVSLLRGGHDPQARALGVRPGGLGGLTAAEIALKGTVQSRTGYVALVQGLDNKTYIVRAGDRLLDGTVRAITGNSMVILQQVNDPLSLQKEREVRKVIREADEAK